MEHAPNDATPLTGLAAVLRCALVFTGIAAALLGMSASAGFSDTGFTLLFIAFLVALAALVLWAVLAGAWLVRRVRWVLRVVRRRCRSGTVAANE